MRSLPPLAAIRAFEAAARHKNYTRAGEELGLTQAGVSYQIKSLEQRLGMPLFVRDGRSMELTAAGAALAPQIEQAFATMELAFSDLGTNYDSILTIACFQTFATKLLAPRLGKFQLANPDVAVRLDVSNSFVDLEAGECDVAIRLSRDVPTGMEAHVLMPHEIAAFASPEFLADRSDLHGDDPSISDANRISRRNEWWQLWDKGRSPKPMDASKSELPRGLQFDSQVLDAAVAASGDGIALLSPEMFLAEIRAGTLLQVGSRIIRPDAVYRLIFPEIRRHSEKVRAFKAWLAKEFGDNFEHLPALGAAAS